MHTATLTPRRRHYQAPSQPARLSSLHTATPTQQPSTGPTEICQALVLNISNQNIRLDTAAQPVILIENYLGLAQQANGSRSNFDYGNTVISRLRMVSCCENERGVNPVIYIFCTTKIW